MKTGPIIDMHGHQGPSNNFKMWRCSTAGMLAEMDRNGVQTLVMSPHRAFAIPEANYQTPGILAEARGRFLAYWVAHPGHTGSITTQIAFLEKHAGFVGLKFHAGWHESPLEGQKYRPYWEYANARGLIALAHTWGGSPVCGFDNCRAVAECYPNVKLILGHSGYHEHPRFSALARDHANVYLDTCAVGSISGAIETMASIAGSCKVVFGTDLPWFDPGYMIGAVCSSRIREEDKRAILHDNAHRLLHGN